MQFQLFTLLIRTYNDQETGIDETFFKRLLNIGIVI